MIRFKLLVRGLALGLVVANLVLPRLAGAAPEGNGASGATRPPPTGAEFARLEAQVNEQRQLIIQLMQNEQQRYDMLLKLIGSANATGPMPPPGETPADASGGPHGTGAADGGSAIGAGKAGKGSTPAIPQHKVAALEGKVSVASGDLSDVYVFIENVRGAPVRNRTIEIKQENKQFSPRLAVVQTGTQVVFPNLDTVFHNVFSTSPKNAFDLGSYRAGDKPRSVVMTSPGLVEVFCNVHQKMNVNIMVVPNNLYTKVRADGSFRIENVPVGARKVVAWSPNTKVVAQKIEVTPSGGQATFSLEYEEAQSHTNKLGLPYGSYK
jgi:plastocyanin